VETGYEEVLSAFSTLSVRPGTILSVYYLIKWLIITGFFSFLFVHFHAAITRIMSTFVFLSLFLFVFPFLFLQTKGEKIG
jgi:hypothetical protein